MLSRQEFQDATDAAYEACEDFFRPPSGRSPGCTLVRHGNRNNPRLLAKKFARQCGKSEVNYSGSIRKPGYGSWLMLTGTGKKPKVCFNYEQLEEWANLQPARKGFSGFIRRIYSRFFGNFVRNSHTKTKGYREDSMVIRCIYHEIGHVLIQPHLFQNTQGLADKVPAEAERQPWVFAMTVLGIMTGEYAS